MNVAPISALLAVAGPAVSGQSGVHRPTHAPPRVTMPPIPRLSRQLPHGVEHGPVPAHQKVPGPAIAPGSINEHAAHRSSRAAAEEFLRRPNAVAAPSMRAPIERRMPGTVGRSATSARRVSMVDVTAPNLTGINRWWSYEEGPLPGVGRYMINVWQENLILQADDMDVHYRGIDLAFRRTYNSYSTHDYAGTDGSVPIGHYGNGWTNTFDAHMAQNTAGGMSVYDIDGARYDYSYDAGGNLVPPPGMEGTSLITYDGGSFYWTKKSGTQYTFYAPYYGGSMTAYSGRIYRIAARNRRNYIQFTYAWDNGDASASAHLSQIFATTDSGKQTVLWFADFNGRRLLSTLSFPDGVTSIAYGYDANGNLNVVRKPGSATPYVYESYGGYKGPQIYVAGPRWNDPGDPAPGYTILNLVPGSYNTGQVNYVVAAGTVNFQPNDGTSTYLQPGTTAGPIGYRYSSLGVGQSGYTPMWDTDGHVYEQVYDSLGRPTIRYVWNGSQWLATVEQWDAHNNRIADVDMRGNQTDYAYDANGNTIAVAEPATTTTQGTFRPTRLYDYDAFNNVVAYCDQTQTHQGGADWVAAPAASDSLCASRAGNVPHATFAYTYPDYEPNGELTAMTAPTGYTRRLAYEPSHQAGADYGLPTAVIGDAFVQLDGTSIAPTQTFWYDLNGYLRCHSKGQGASVLSYDALGRMTSVADPDDSSANGTSLCGKTSGQAGWNTQTTYAYNADGTMQSSQSPSERAAGVSTTFAYDADGDETSETHHYTCVSWCAGTTTKKWYDGGDRLVEVALPHDPNDYFSFGWLTRYIYDVSAGSGMSVAGQAVSGYGNLVKTQEWNIAPGATNPSWLDMKGNAFDPLDRPTKKIGYQPGTGTPTIATMTYDGDALSVGLLTSTRNPEGETATYSYDPRSAVTHVAFTATLQPTLDKTYGYDANGRRTLESNTAFGAKTSQYDVTGVLASVHEASGGNVSSPATISYDYYPDGSRKDVNVASSQLTANGVLAYSYRADGARTRATLNYGNVPYSFGFTYTDGGRMTSRTDPYTNTIIPNPAAPVAAGSRYAPQTWAYDATGQLTGLGMPYAYAYTGISHDAEGHMVGWHTNVPSEGDVGMAFTNSVRGENVGSRLTTAAHGLISSSGVSLAHGSVFSLDIHTSTIDFLDPYNGVITARHGYTQHDPYGGDVPTSVDCPNPNYVRDTYDRAGRMTNHETIVYDSAPVTCGGDGWSDSYAYDAEDHTVTVDGACVGWGPDGRATVFSNVPCPAQPGPGVANDTLHYDGDTILFVTTVPPHNVSTSIRLEQLGALNIDSTGAHFIVGDREMTGTLVASHSDLGYTGIKFGTKVWQVHTPESHGGGPSWTNTASVVIAPSTNGFPYGASLGAYTYVAPDGFSFGGKKFQGVRVMDPETAHWTTPDAYAGDMHDPMSQKPFMWNRNNPYAYSDPSGYFPDQVLACGVAWGGSDSSDRVAVAGPYDGPKDMSAEANNAVIVAFGHEESKGSFNNRTSIEIVAKFLDQHRYEVGNPTQLKSGAYQVNATNPVTGSTAQITMNGRQADIRVSYFGQTLTNFSTRYQWFGRGDLRFQYYNWDKTKWAGARII